MRQPLALSDFFFFKVYQTPGFLANVSAYRLSWTVCVSGITFTLRVCMHCKPWLLGCCTALFQFKLLLSVLIHCIHWENSRITVGKRQEFNKRWMPFYLLQEESGLLDTSCTYCWGILGGCWTNFAEFGESKGQSALTGIKVGYNEVLYVLEWCWAAIRWAILMLETNFQRWDC